MPIEGCLGFYEGRFHRIPSAFSIGNTGLLSRQALDATKMARAEARSIRGAFRRQRAEEAVYDGSYVR